MLSSGSEEETTTTQRRRTIKLYNPSSPNTLVPYLVDSEDQRIDLASIARIFGILPASLKLNGYFIGRGLNFISSVTWKSLLSFFSSRRLPTGEDRAHAVVVDGKLLKAGAKRSYEPQSHDMENHSSSLTGVNRMPVHEVMNSRKKKRLTKRGSGSYESQGRDMGIHSSSVTGVKRILLHEVMNSIKKKRLSKSDTGRRHGDLQNGAGLKRKYVSDDINNLLKKLKVNETNLAISPKIQELNFHSSKIQELIFHAVA